MKKTLLFIIALASLMGIVSCDIWHKPVDVLMVTTRIETPALSDLNDRCFYVSSEEAFTLDSSKGTSNTFMWSDMLTLYNDAKLRRKSGYYLRFVLTCNPDVGKHALVNIEVRLFDGLGEMIWQSSSTSWSPMGISVDLNSSTLSIGGGMEYITTSGDSNDVKFKAVDLDSVVFSLSPLVD